MIGGISVAKYRTKKDWNRLNRTSLGAIYTCQTATT